MILHVRDCLDDCSDDCRATFLSISSALVKMLLPQWIANFDSNCENIYKLALVHNVCLRLCTAEFSVKLTNCNCWDVSRENWLVCALPLMRRNMNQANLIAAIFNGISKHLNEKCYLLLLLPSIVFVWVCVCMCVEMQIEMKSSKQATQK